VKSLVAKGIDLGWVMDYPSLVAWSEVVVLEQSWGGIVTNASKMRGEKFGCKRN